MAFFRQPEDPLFENEFRVARAHNGDQVWVGEGVGRRAVDVSKVDGRDQALGEERPGCDS